MKYQTCAEGQQVRGEADADTYSSSEDFHDDISSKIPCRMPARSSRFTRVLELVELPCEGKLTVADLGLGSFRMFGLPIWRLMLDKRADMPT